VEFLNIFAGVLRWKIGRIYILLKWKAKVSKKKYIFFGPDGLKEAMIKALLLKAKVTRVRVFPDGSVKEMVIYSGTADSASACSQ